MGPGLSGVERRCQNLSAADSIALSSSKMTKAFGFKEKMFAVLGRTSGTRNSQPGKTSPGLDKSSSACSAASANCRKSDRERGYSANGSRVVEEILRTDLCDSTSNCRIDSTSSPKNSTRTGLAA